MKSLFFAVLSSTSLLIWPTNAKFDHAHKSLSRILRKVVHHHEGHMLVDYRRLKASPKHLNTYLKKIGAVNEQVYQTFSNTQKLAFLINAHNAFTLKLVVDRYPIKSIKGIGGGADWKNIKVSPLLGKKRDLAYIEGQMAVQGVQDVRAYFALAYASMGGPNLRPAAYTANKLDNQLRKAERNFIKDRSKNTYRKKAKILKVSRIFEWFAEHFKVQHISVEDYLKKKFKVKRQVTITMAKYDWVLNDWKRQASQTLAPVVRRWTDTTLASPLQLKTSDALLNYFSASDDDAQGNHPAEHMMQHWNESLQGRNFFAVPSTSISNLEYDDYESYADDQEMGIYVHNTWFADVPMSVLAMNYYKGYRRYPDTPREWIEVIHSDIVVNGLQQLSTNPNSWSTYHLPSILLHEMGHFLGLGHIASEKLAVMNPSLSRLQSYSAPFDSDIQSLKANYAQAKALATNNEGENEIVRGWTELHANGVCRHYSNGQMIKKHTVWPGSPRP